MRRVSLVGNPLAESETLGQGSCFLGPAPHRLAGCTRYARTLPLAPTSHTTWRTSNATSSCRRPTLAAPSPQLVKPSSLGYSRRLLRQEPGRSARASLRPPSPWRLQRCRHPSHDGGFSPFDALLDLFSPDTYTERTLDLRLLRRRNCHAAVEATPSKPAYLKCYSKALNLEKLRRTSNTHGSQRPRYALNATGHDAPRTPRTPRESRIPRTPRIPRRPRRPTEKEK